MKTEQYVIALKRSHWGKTRLTDALHRLDTVPNCTVVGDTSGVRTLIEASDQAYRQIQAKLEDCCYVEPVILHTRQ